MLVGFTGMAFVVIMGFGHFGDSGWRDHAAFLGRLWRGGFDGRRRGWLVGGAGGPAGSESYQAGGGKGRDRPDTN